MKFILEIDLNNDTSRPELRDILRDVSLDIKLHGLSPVGQLVVIPDKDTLDSKPVGQWLVVEGLHPALVLLKDIYEHLSGGAPLHPGSLIFEEDEAAIAVIGNYLRKAKALPERP